MRRSRLLLWTLASTTGGCQLALSHYSVLALAEAACTPPSKLDGSVPTQIWPGGTLDAGLDHTCMATISGLPLCVSFFDVRDCSLRFVCSGETPSAARSDIFSAFLCSYYDFSSVNLYDYVTVTSGTDNTCFLKSAGAIDCWVSLAFLMR